MSCPRCGSRLEKNVMLKIEECKNCGYTVPIGDDIDVEWNDSNETEDD